MQYFYALYLFLFYKGWIELMNSKENLVYGTRISTDNSQPNNPFMKDKEVELANNTK